VDPRNLSIDDRRWEQLTEHDRVEAALALERAAREVDPRVHLEPLTWEDGRTHRLFASSAGLRGEEHGTTFSAAAAVRVAAEDAIVALSERVWSRSFSTLASLPFAASMARRAVAMLGPRAHVAGPVRVMFAPHATAALLGGLVESLFDPALEGQTFLDRGKPLSPRLHVLDDGQLAGGLFARSFDDRGVPPVPVVVIREGRRDQRFLGPAAARGADTRPTGHWRDGRLRPTNLVVRGGTRSINALLSERADVETLVVTDLVGVDGVDWRTGEARLLAYGTLRRGNVEVGVVPGVHLVGRLDEALRQVVELSSDTDRVGAIDAPGLMVDGLVAAP
jgi:predicted Zn-dependent protease